MKLNPATLWNASLAAIAAMTQAPTRTAAPELLGAVQSAVSLLTDPDAGEDEANQVLAELEAALAKAKGEL